MVFNFILLLRGELDNFQRKIHLSLIKRHIHRNIQSFGRWMIIFVAFFETNTQQRHIAMYIDHEWCHNFEDKSVTLWLTNSPLLLDLINFILAENWVWIIIWNEWKYSEISLLFFIRKIHVIRLKSSIKITNQRYSDELEIGEEPYAWEWINAKG